MGRKMVKMARITNEKTRITTYKKRKACLFKKANEFSTLCGVDTCLIVYGPSRAGDEMVVEPELWPRDESKVREIISKYRDNASSSCSKTYTIQECLEKSNTTTNNKVEKVKYCTWDKKFEKGSLNELYAAFVAIENKIQEAANRSQTFPDTHWSTDQLGLFGYNQQCLEQHQLFPLSSKEQNGFSYLNQMPSNTAEMGTFSTMTEPEGMFYGSYSDCMEPKPMQWSVGNTMLNNMKQFVDYPFKYAQLNDLDHSNKLPM